jgi:cardiolipin synthase A/B
MEPVLLAVTEIVSLLPPSRVQSIADRIRVSTPEVAGRTLHQLVSTPAARAALDDLVSSWKTSAISGEHLSGLLIGAAHLRRHTLREGNIELVWTGPQTPFVPTRRTEQVLLDLINRAKTDIFLVSFVAFDFPTVVDALNAAISRDVDVKVLLESSVSHGGSLSVDPVATMRKHVPVATLFAWTDRAAPFADGKVHAKVAVADGEIAFLTSANLTGHALEKNMEAGVVIDGGKVPQDLRAHLEALIATKVIRKL